MKALGFEWVSDTEIGFGDALLDLHKEYAFRTLGYDVVKRMVSLQWFRRNEDWVLETLPDRFALALHDVTSVRVTARDAEQPFTEDDCLRGFAYWTDAEWCEEPFWTRDRPDDTWHWVFEFMSDAKIFVAGKEATAFTR